MPSFFPEGDAPVATDPSNKSLQKINSLLQSIDSKTGGAGGGGLTNAELRASPVPVDIGGNGSITITSGTVTVSNEVEVTNSTGNPIPISGTVTANTGLSQPLTDTQLRATAVPVSGTFWPATQPISGTVSVSNFPATQPISGTVTANTGLSQPLTDAQLRASAVPIINGFSIPEYDSVLLSNYDGQGNVGTVIYRKNGNTLATLSLTYNGSGQLTAITKS